MRAVLDNPNIRFFRIAREAIGVEVLLRLPAMTQDKSRVAVGRCPMDMQDMSFRNAIKELQRRRVVEVQVGR